MNVDTQSTQTAHTETEREREPSVSYVKGLSASAVALRVRVGENKLRSQPVRHKVHLCADDVHQALPVHEYPDPIRLNLFIELPLLIWGATPGNMQSCARVANAYHVDTVSFRYAEQAKELGSSVYGGVGGWG